MTSFAGDSLFGYSVNGMQFTTFDHDNDHVPYNCAAESRKGEWWFKYCSCVNANGIYKLPGTSNVDTIYWWDFRKRETLKYISMKIQPKEKRSS